MFWMIAGALLIGISLGLMGSGGSIFTVPILVYVLGHDINISVAESMAIVGSIALVGGVPNIFAKQIDWKNVWFFGIPGMLGTYLGAWLGSHYFSGPAKLFLLALIMLVAAWTMFRKKDSKSDELQIEKTKSESSGKLVKIILEGTAVGVVTGIVGVGGGFLIVPALVILGGLSMRIAVGTSLMIIALKSIVGFAKYQYELVQVDLSVDWNTVITFSILGAIGTFVGRLISNSINQATLRRVFAVVLFAMAILIVAFEAPGAFSKPDSNSEEEAVSSVPNLPED